MSPRTHNSDQSIDFSTALNTTIDHFFERSISKALTINPHYETLWKELHRLIQSGGKRLRPRMTALAYEAFGGTDIVGMLPIAAAQELLHLSMLVHDDIIDRDYIRYGVANIAGGYDKIYSPLVSNTTDRLHYARSAALLGGDLLISASYQLMTESTLAPDRVIAAQHLFSKSIFEVAGGELLDTESVFRPLGEISAETIAHYKTASYSFIGPLMIGALLADAPHEDQAYLRLFAENLGIAYQLTDDIIGVFGDEEKTGKSNTSDIREGKRTYTIEQFYARSTPEQKELFGHYFGDRQITTEQVDIIKGLLISTGARQKTDEAIARYEVKAHSALDSLSINKPFHDSLSELITTVIRRDR